MDYNKLCSHCMRESDTVQGQPCPYCGKPYHTTVELQHQLKPFTVLKGKFMVGDVLGEGGFGITYIGFDMELEMKVAIKEFYPNGYASRESVSTNQLTIYTGSNQKTVEKWRESFLKEARSLGKLSHLSGVVGVREYFQENNTAYIIMEFLEGQTLKAYTASQGGRLSPAFLLPAIEPVLTSLAEVHKQGMIHRDISPDNIMIAPDGSMKILDFGAARDFTGSQDKSLSVMLKPGYAPEEQYRSKGNQGPWSDVYAMAGTIYRTLTGVLPPEAMERVRNDTLTPPNQLGAGLSPAQEQALLNGLAVFADNRYQNMTDFHRDLYQSGYVAPLSSGGSSTVAMGFRQGNDRTVAMGVNTQSGFSQGGYDPSRTTGMGQNTQGGFSQSGYDPNRTTAMGQNAQGGFSQGGYDPNRTTAMGQNTQGGFSQAGYDPNRTTAMGQNTQGGFPQGGYDPNRTTAMGQNTQSGFQQGYAPGPAPVPDPNTQGGYAQQPYFQEKKSSAGLWIALGCVAGVLVIGGAAAFFLLRKPVETNVSEEREERVEIETREESEAETGPADGGSLFSWGGNEEEAGEVVEEEPETGGRDLASWDSYSVFKDLLAQASESVEQANLGDARTALENAGKLAASSGYISETQGEMQEAYQNYIQGTLSYLSVVVQQEYNSSVFNEVKEQEEKADKLAGILNEQGFVISSDESLDRFVDNYGERRLIEKFDQEALRHASGEPYSRTEMWSLMQDLGDDEGNYTAGDNDLEDPLRRRYAYAYAGHLHSELEKGNTDVDYVIRHLENTDYNPILLKLLSDQYRNSAASYLVDYFTDDIMQVAEGDYGFSSSDLKGFGDFWYFCDPGDLGNGNGCSSSSVKKFIDEAEAWFEK